jgi:hypothetical protein
VTFPVEPPAGSGEPGPDSLEDLTGREPLTAADRAESPETEQTQPSAKDRAAEGPPGPTVEVAAADTSTETGPLEPVHPAPDPGADAASLAAPASGPEEPFTVGEKIRSVLEALLAATDRAEGETGAALSVLRWLIRSRWIAGRILPLFPPLEDEQAWHSWLTVAAGLALNLTSDGYELDVDEARAVGREILAELLV